MAALWIILIAIATFMATIALVVIGQEYHPLISIGIAALLVFGAIKLFQARVTRI